MEDITFTAEQHRRNLIEWSTTDNNKKWYKGTTLKKLPDKIQLDALGMNAIGEGWLPNKPLITPHTRVHAIGSCFARYFILWLAEHGFNKIAPDSPYNALLRFGSDFESAAVIAQQFRWAFGELEDKTLLWISKHKEIFAATEEKRQLVRNTFLATDVLIITLGLSEVWYDKIAEEPLWRALTSDQFNPEQHVFRIESMAQTLHWLETIERIRATHLPHLKIVFTVSPVRLASTFRHISPYSANSVSKAILRAAVDEFLRNHSSDLNHHLFYYPSYEFATDYFLNAYEQDERHISSTVAASIIRFFVKHYCSAEIATRSGKSLTDLDTGEYFEQFILQTRDTSLEERSGEMSARISELEKKIKKLQEVCDERQEVINILDKAARERLEIIHRLENKEIES
jgi:hypothetical protein